jgi:hypothetical protein
VCALIVSWTVWPGGQRSPGYFGYFGPDFADWITTNMAIPHPMILGRRTYELLNALTAEARDEGSTLMTSIPGWLFSRTLQVVHRPGL